MILGGTLMNESISSCCRATHGQEYFPEDHGGKHSAAVLNAVANVVQNMSVRILPLLKKTVKKHH